MSDNKGTIEHFDGWEITCPHCRHPEFVWDDEMTFCPHDDEIHILVCKSCGEEFEL